MLSNIQFHKLHLTETNISNTDNIFPDTVRNTHYSNHGYTQK